MTLGRRARLWGTVALAVAAAAGCEGGFPPYSRLVGLRVLAIQSEPAAPAPGESATLSPLVYLPSADSTLTYSWSWCPLPGKANDGYPCQVTADQLGAMAGVPGASVPDFDLGTGSTATLPHTVDPAVYARICAGLAGEAAPPDCQGGFPVLIKLVVQTDTDRVEAIRTLRLRIDPNTPANANPHIDGLTADIDGETQSIGADPMLSLPRSEDTVIHALVAAEAAESYMGVDDGGQPALVHERLILSWFVETGDLDADRTSFIAGETQLEDALQNKWRPASRKNFQPDSARVMVVVQDSRDGVGWLGGAVTLTEVP
jgi:hypothetical protein